MTDYTQQVQELNPGEMPMVATDYYKFMLAGGFIDSRIECKSNYLADRFAFVRGQDSISRDCIDTLNAIGTQFYYQEVLPKNKT